MFCKSPNHHVYCKHRMKFEHLQHWRKLLANRWLWNDFNMCKRPRRKCLCYKSEWMPRSMRAELNRANNMTVWCFASNSRKSTEIANYALNQAEPSRPKGLKEWTSTNSTSLVVPWRLPSQYTYVRMFDIIITKTFSARVWSFYIKRNRIWVSCAQANVWKTLHNKCIWLETRLEHTGASGTAYAESPWLRIYNWKNYAISTSYSDRFTSFHSERTYIIAQQNRFERMVWRKQQQLKNLSFDIAILQCVLESYFCEYFSVCRTCRMLISWDTGKRQKNIFSFVPPVSNSCPEKLSTRELWKNRCLVLRVLHTRMSI